MCQGSILRSSKVAHLEIVDMIVDQFEDQPGFPFDRYFEDTNQYIAAQQYWHAVLRAAVGFSENNWQPVEKSLDLDDDMYTGLVVDVEYPSARKIIKIHSSSVAGNANLILREGLETAKLMGTRTGADMFGPEIYDDYEKLLADGAIAPPITTQAAAEAEARGQDAKTGGFQAGVERRDFYDETQEGSAHGPYVYGEECLIVAQISPHNEPRVLEALRLFLKPGVAMERVNAKFVE